MADLDPSHHIFRYIGGGSIAGDFIDPAAFRRKMKDGKMEEGLSVNWVEYFEKATPEEAIAPLRQIFDVKTFKIGTTAKFALLNVASAKNATAKYANVSIVLDEQENDLSHSLIRDYDEAFNDQIAEELQKVIIDSFPAKQSST